ncbi:MAG: isoleucine--tRNA ligase [Candidatus Omnitrophica bacterium]|nr:isoleucine--tRNA ligase [Candidatus Omnitrophota bacterium]
MDYKSTLNLPRTNFSMKANLPNLEPKILLLWQDLKIYHRLREERKGRKKFILHDGPPYANGSIHIGHALNKILKDIILKYKIMQGFDCPFIVGWDCHGLPVEHQLFKELNLTMHDVDIVDFRKKAKDFALKFVELQKQDFKRLGIFSDWDNPYFTLNPEYESKVIELLEYLVGEGFIHRAKLPVNWCGRCETALAEAEVEYLNKESDSIYLLFKAIDPKKLLENSRDTALEEIYFLVWTTTPWTLISNVAVAVHPQFDYCLVEFNDKTPPSKVSGWSTCAREGIPMDKLIVLAKDLIPQVEEKIGVKFRVVDSFKGVKLEHLKLQHPFFQRSSPVVLADFISPDEGSGCVHIAPGHGEEDFSLVKKYALSVLMTLNDKGIFDGPPEFKGSGIREANDKVLQKLKENGFILKHEKIIHSYPHCWRCKNPIIFRATSQWFLDVDHKNLRNKLLEEIKGVKWVPKAGFERMKAMLISRPDWCLSRQRYWGIPIPAVKCKACGEIILDREILAAAGRIFKKNGSDSWFSLDLAEFLPSKFSCHHCGQTEFLKEFDILDVWFESGASFYAVVKNHSSLEFPADMYLEGSDQHRGWFQVSLIPSVAKEKISPFKAVLTHGFVVDADNKKMSKSSGNVIAPQSIIKEHGAEILRLWAAYNDVSVDVKISKNIIRQLVDIYRKIRNTIRFILGNLYDFDYTKCSLEAKSLVEVDRFMLSKTMLFYKEVISHYENFSFYKAVGEIFNFCNQLLSSFYLDILKDRLYTFSPDSQDRRSAQFVLYHILKILNKLIAPVLSFTAEEVHSCRGEFKGEDESIFVSTFDKDCDPQWLDEKLNRRWEKILCLRDKVLKEIEKEREKGIIASSQEAEVLLKFEGEDYSFYSSYEYNLNEIFIVSRVTIEKGDFQIKIEKAKGEKCLRCWNYREDVGRNSKFPQTCDRCVKVLEQRNKQE